MPSRGASSFRRHSSIARPRMEGVIEAVQKTFDLSAEGLRSRSATTARQLANARSPPRLASAAGEACRQWLRRAVRDENERRLPRHRERLSRSDAPPPRPSPAPGEFPYRFWNATIENLAPSLRPHRAAFRASGAARSDCDMAKRSANVWACPRQARGTCRFTPSNESDGAENFGKRLR